MTIIVFKSGVWVFASVALLLMLPVACANELSWEFVRPVSVVSSSGDRPPNYVVGNSIDGVLSDRWECNLTQWVPTWNLKVDLGGSFKINGVRVYITEGGNPPCQFNLYKCNSSSCYGLEGSLHVDPNSYYNWSYAGVSSPEVGSQVFLDQGEVWGQSSQYGDYVCDVYNSFGRQGLSEFAELEVNASAYGAEIGGFGPNQSVVSMGQAALIMVNLSSAYHTYNISKAWFTVDGNFTNITAASDGSNSILWTSTMLPRSQYTLIGYVNDSKNHVTASTPVTVFIETTTTTVTTSTTTTLQQGPVNYVNNYTYDANGNMLEDNGFKYEYNGMNMLKTVKNATNDAIVEQYWYGSDGQRIKKVSFLPEGGNRTTYYVNPSYEININETGTRQDTRYVFANGERVTEIAANGSKTYYLNDHLGSSSVLVNEQGQLVDRLTYYPFGEVKSGGTGSKYGYNNKELDSTRLNYYGARYYNPALKRWTQADIIIKDVYAPQGLNRYTYVENRPIINKDSNGAFAIYFGFSSGWGFDTNVNSQSWGLLTVINTNYPFDVTQRSFTQESLNGFSTPQQTAFGFNMGVSLTSNSANDFNGRFSSTEVGGGGVIAPGVSIQSPENNNGELTDGPAFVGFHYTITPSIWGAWSKSFYFSTTETNTELHQGWQYSPFWNKRPNKLPTKNLCLNTNLFMGGLISVSKSNNNGGNLPNTWNPNRQNDLAPSSVVSSSNSNSQNTSHDYWTPYDDQGQCK